MIRSLFAIAFGSLTLIACTDQLTEEEAENDSAFTDGKADAFGFKLGQWLPLDDYNDDGNEHLPLVAAFHAKDRDVPAGDHGHFDLVRYTGDADSTYASGTFRLYKYQGRNRIRFATYEGRVVWRTDWSFDDGKLVLDGHGMYEQNVQPSQLVDCLATEILDGNVFEEGLTPYEYPDVEINKVGDKFSLDIGAASYDPNEATITIESTTRELVARAKYSTMTYTIKIPAKAPRRGEILAQEDGGEESTVASIVCRP